MKKYFSRMIYVLIVLSIVIITFTSCRNPVEQYDFSSTEELDVNESFTFRTIEAITVDLDISNHPIYDITGLSNDYKAPVFSLMAYSSTDTAVPELLETNNQTTIDELQTAGRLYDLGSFVMEDDQSFTGTISVPTTYDTLIIDFLAAGLPSLEEQPIEVDSVSYLYSRYMNRSSKGSVSEPNDITSDLLDDINATIPEIEANPDSYIEDNLSFTITENGTKLDVVFISEDTISQESIEYTVTDGTGREVSSGTIFPDADTVIGDVQSLGTFDAGTINLAIGLGESSEESRGITRSTTSYGTAYVYSPSGTSYLVSNVYVYGWGTTSNGIYVVNVYTPSSGTVSTTTDVEETDDYVDTDFDGISDSLDEFPEDAGLAAEQSYSGTVAFEDKWPQKGDYDFNDLVASYEYTLRTDADNNLRSLQYEITIEALGGGYKNGLYLKLNDVLESDLLATATADIVMDDDYTNAFDGEDSDSDIIHTTDGIEDYGSPAGIVLKLIENANTFVSNETTILNTDPDKGIDHTFDPVSVTGSLYFSADSSLTQTELGDIPFDLFIMSDVTLTMLEESLEIHLPDIPPSGLGTIPTLPITDQNVDDDSDPSSGKFYRSEANLPWAIHIPAAWDYPLEESDILLAYINFDAWAMSMGEESSDWYLSEDENINTEFIYQYLVD